MSYKKKSLEHCNKEEKEVELFLVRSLDTNIKILTRIFKNDETIIIRKLQNKFLKEANCCLIYLDGMVNTELLNENIIQPILENNLTEKLSLDNLLEELEYKIIVSNNISKENMINNIVSSLISGDTIFLLEGFEKALIIDSKGWSTRAITEPDSDRGVRGPREGFTESIMVNLSLLRRKINPLYFRTFEQFV